jgi:hypothetical protein
MDLSDPTQLNSLLKAAVGRTGHVIVPDPVSGTPHFIHSPNLVWSNGLRDELKTMTGLSEETQEKWPEEIQERINEDPKEVTRLFAQSYWYSTNWMQPTSENQSPREYMINAAKKMNQYVDVELLEGLLDAGVIVENAADGHDTQGALPFGHFVRMVVAASPSVIESVQIPERDSLSYRDPKNLPSIEDRVAAAKLIMKDFDPLDGKGLSELGFGTNIADLNFMSRPKGGMSLQFRSLTGASGKNYLEYLTTDIAGGGFSKTAGGPYTPRNSDSTPVFFISADQGDPSGPGMGEYSRNKVNVKRFISSLNGTYKPQYVSSEAKTVPAIGRPNPESLIPLVTEPSMRTEMDALVEADAPLTTVDNFVTFQTVNNNGIWDIVDNDPALKNLKAMRYEVATKPNGIRMFDKNKTLFSPENMELLFEQAVKSGAKTNKDMLGFMFRAMELYKENPSTRFGREVTLEQDTQSSPEDFLGVSGRHAGVVLYTQQSDNFYAGVASYLDQGYNLYQRGDKFYMFKPDSVPEKGKFTLRLASGSPEQNASVFAPYARRQANAKVAREVIFAPEAAPVVEASTQTPTAAETPVVQEKTVKTVEINNKKWGMERAEQNTSDTATLRFDEQFNTVLGSKQQERAYTIWKEKNAPEYSEVNYDLRGAFVAGLVVDSNGKLPDTFNKPNHPEFSDNSVYAQLGYDKPGKWFPKPKNNKYPEGAIIDKNTGQYFMKPKKEAN